MQPLKIGILNVMHDKPETNARFTNVLTHSGRPVALHFYYPTTHYPGGVPADVSRILAPLDLTAAAEMDGFIITGAPIERFAFDDVTYIAEARALMDVLAAHRVSQLYLCWGGMAALDHFYGIRKHMLPHKLFGVYRQRILAPSSLLQGLPEAFTRRTRGTPKWIAHRSKQTHGCAWRPRRQMAPYFWPATGRPGRPSCLPTWSTGKKACCTSTSGKLRRTRTAFTASPSIISPTPQDERAAVQVGRDAAHLFRSVARARGR